MNLGILIERMQQLPAKVQTLLLKYLRFAERTEGTPSGSVLVAIYLLEFLGVPRYLDELLGQENTPVLELRKQYKASRRKKASPPMPSPGLIVSLLIADMVACPKHLIRISNVEEMAERWKTGPLLGIAPFLLNDDRILRTLSMLGSDVAALKESLHVIVAHVAKTFNISMDRFFVDTTVLQLDGKFTGAPKVTPGRGRDSFSQLVIGLTIASGSRLPVAFGVNPGNTFDAHTLAESINSINKVAQPGPVEIYMDRIFATPENIHLFHEYQEKREMFWTSPLKTGLVVEKFRHLVKEICDNNGWFPISYRSVQETRNKIDPPLTAYETTWTITYEQKPEKTEGTRRPKGSIKKTYYTVRLVVYRHALRAEQEKKARLQKRQELEQVLQEFQGKINKRNLITIETCQKAAIKLLAKFRLIKSLVNLSFSTNEHKAVEFSWTWDEEAFTNEEQFDGVFALLTNNPKKRLSANKLLTGYRERNEVEVDFKDLRGLLELERIFVRLPERIESYIFLKILAYLVLAFLRWYAKEKGDMKMTEKQIQETLGALLINEGEIQPIGIPVYSLGNDKQFTQWVRTEFGLPDPLEIIKELNEAAEAQFETAVLSWYEKMVNKNVDKGGNA